jgi:acyl-CoA reductase-like NAD-dependent aldehyde dehydrogenase
VSDYLMSIAGKLVRADRTIEVRNPATGEPFASAPDCSRGQLDDAMHAARDAYPGWRVDEAARRAALKRIADILNEQADDLARLLVTEQGKPLLDARREITTAALWFSYYADLDIPVETIQDDERATVVVLRRPIGVVAAITPWNYPVVQASWKLAPALLAGNTVVLKPSPYTPLTNLRLGELLLDVLPPGVLNIVSGGDELGRAMTEHEIPLKVSFTGSVATGKKVAMATAPDLKRTTLELGGNDAAIILDDMDPVRAAEGLFAGAFANCGQVCSAIKRAYVPERLYADLVEALAEQARTAKVGNGLTEGVRIGPINNRPQFERVSGLVEDARAHGARIVAGGGPGEGGYFYQPTILADVSDGVRIVDEEQFGPALPVIAYTDVEDAVRRANATHFGLSGSVWSADPDRAADVGAQLECGTVWVNTHRALSPHQPFGGHKWSGLGTENGPWGLLGFTNIQVVHRAK